MKEEEEKGQQLEVMVLLSREMATEEIRFGES